MSHALLDASGSVCLDDVVIPSQLWLAYSVCDTELQLCGWAGWILESLRSGEVELNGGTHQP